MQTLSLSSVRNTTNIWIETSFNLFLSWISKMIQLDSPKKFYKSFLGKLLNSLFPKESLLNLLRRLRDRL
jgi:hypothetical protein